MSLICEPNFEPNLFSKGALDLMGDSRCDASRCDTSRLRVPNDPTRSKPCLKAHQRQLCRFSATRFTTDDNDLIVLNGFNDLIATLEDLDVSALVKILVEPKNALVKQYGKLFDMENVDLSFTDDALTAIAKRAIERKTGARGLRSILESILLDTMFDLPSMQGVGEVVVDKEVVAGKKEPVRVFSEKQNRAEDAA